MQSGCFLSAAHVTVSQVKIPARIFTFTTCCELCLSSFTAQILSSSTLNEPTTLLLNLFIAPVHIYLVINDVCGWWWEGGEADVHYLIKMWYSCSAQFSGINCLAQTFPLTKIKFSNWNARLSDAYVNVDYSSQFTEAALVVDDLWPESYPGVGLFSTDPLKERQTLMLVLTERGQNGVELPWGWLLDWDFNILSPGSSSWMYPKSDLHCFQFVSSTLV